MKVRIEQNVRDVVQTTTEELRRVENSVNRYSGDYQNGNDFLRSHHENVQQKMGEAESTLDTVDQTFSRITDVIEAVEQLKEVFIRKIDTLLESCSSEREILAINNNRIIDEINSLDESITLDVNVRAARKRQNELLRKNLEEVSTTRRYVERINQLEQQVSQLTNQNTQLNTLVNATIPTINSNITEIKESTKLSNVKYGIREIELNDASNLRPSERSQLEAWTGKRCDMILFDSTVHNWAMGTSVFDASVMYVPHIVFVIEDTNGNKFGCYLNEQIKRVSSHINDPNAFVFSIKSNGMNRYPIAKANEAVFMYPKDHHWLLSIGSDGGRGGTDDITIMKSNCQHMRPGNGCVQQTYNYGGVRNALCGSTSFDVKRIIVIRMK